MSQDIRQKNQPKYFHNSSHGLCPVGTDNIIIKVRGYIPMDEMQIMMLVVNSGNARSLALEALTDAKDGKFDDAEAKLAEADKVLLDAHEVQTELIQKELNGEGITVSLLVVHSQDHLMTAMLCLDLVKQLVAILKTK
jgi:PTS system cellobiose-specific IIA component